MNLLKVLLVKFTACYVVLWLLVVIVLNVVVQLKQLEEKVEIDLLFFLTVFPAIILFGIAKSGLGGSISLISIPLMTVVMPLNKALAILLPILILSDFIAAFRFRKEFDFETLC